MFYERVKAAWQAGNVRIGLMVGGHDSYVKIEAKGLTALAVIFLNDLERQKLASLEKLDAQLVRNLPRMVHAWTPDERDAVRRLTASVGMGELDSPQRALAQVDGHTLPFYARSTLVQDDQTDK